MSMIYSKGNNRSSLKVIIVTSGCLWPKATVKPLVWNPGPKIEIPHPENHVLKVFRFRSWKPRVWKSRPQSWDPKSWEPCPENHVLKTISCSSDSGCGPVTTQRVTGRTDRQTHSKSTADTKRKQRIKVKQMSKQTPQRAPAVEISGTNCSSGSSSGPVTTQRVMGRTDRQTHYVNLYIRLKTKKMKNLFENSWIN
jgi:hypothetical protein